MQSTFDLALTVLDRQLIDTMVVVADELTTSSWRESPVTPRP